jgi:hypothetical protein
MTKPKRKRKTMQECVNEQIARNQARVADVLVKESRERVELLKGLGVKP